MSIPPWEEGPAPLDEPQWDGGEDWHDSPLPDAPPWDDAPLPDGPSADELEWQNVSDSIPEEDRETIYASRRLAGRTYGSKSFPVKGELSRDSGQPARFIYKVFDNSQESELVLEGDDWVVRETVAGRYQIKLLVAREAGRIKSLWIQRVPGSGRPGRNKTLVSLDRESSAALIELIGNLGNIPVEGATSVRVDDALVRDIFANPNSLVSVYRKDPERFRQLITDDESARDLIAVSHRRQQVERFRSLLRDESFFDEEASRHRRPEDVWQGFFESNPWILGISLTGQLLTGWNKQKLEQVIVGPSAVSVGKRVDAMLRTSGRIRSMVLAEFKTHRTSLLAEPAYRSGCWAPSKDLAGGVAQVQGTLNMAVRDIRERIADLAEDETEIPGEFTYLIKPRTFLIIGMLDSMVGQAGGHDMNRFRSFELYRRNLAEPEVLTFDELLARAEWLVETVDTEV
jgi:hypothetical protein